MKERWLKVRVLTLFGDHPFVLIPSVHRVRLRGVLDRFCLIVVFCDERWVVVPDGCLVSVIVLWLDEVT